jgi:hypothetical protein
MECVLEGRKRSALDNKGKKCEEEESKRKKEIYCDEEMVGSRTSRAYEVVKWTNLIHLGLGF